MGQGLAQVAFFLLVGENVSSLFMYHPPNMVCWWVLIHFGPLWFGLISPFGSFKHKSLRILTPSIQVEEEAKWWHKCQWNFIMNGLLRSCCPMRLKSQKCPPLKLLQWPDMFTMVLYFYEEPPVSVLKKFLNSYGSSSSSTYKWNLESGLGLVLQKKSLISVLVPVLKNQS